MTSTWSSKLSLLISSPHLLLLFHSTALIKHHCQPICDLSAKLIRQANCCSAQNISALLVFVAYFFSFFLWAWNTQKQFMLRHFCFRSHCCCFSFFWCWFIDCWWLLRQSNRTITLHRLNCACCIWRARNSVRKIVWFKFLRYFPFDLWRSSIE